MLSIIIYAVSVSISVILLIWLLKVRSDDPIPKRRVAGMLAGGVASDILVSVLFMAFGVIVIIQKAGMENVVEFLKNRESEEAGRSFVKLLGVSGNTETSFSSALFSAFVVAAIPEEAFKYLFTRICLKKKDVYRKWIDAVICASVVAIGFQIFEDITYSSGGLITAVSRAIMPFHFTFGAIMGYYIGKADAEGKKIYKWLAFLVPCIIHGVFDLSVNLIKVNDMYLLFTIVMLIFMMVLTIYVIRRINRYKKSRTAET